MTKALRHLAWIIPALIMVGTLFAQAPEIVAAVQPTEDHTLKMLFETLGVPGAWAGAIMFILRTLGKFLAKERAAQEQERLEARRHAEELVKTREDLLGKIMATHYEVAKQNEATAKAMESTGEAMLKCTSETRELAREIREMRAA